MYVLDHCSFLACRRKRNRDTATQSYYKRKQRNSELTDQVIHCVKPGLSLPISTPASTAGQTRYALLAAVQNHEERVMDSSGNSSDVVSHHCYM